MYHFFEKNQGKTGFFTGKRFAKRAIADYISFVRCRLSSAG